MANEFDYEAIFGKDFSVIRNGLKDFPVELETMLLNTMDSMVFSVENFARNLESTIVQMTANGIDGKIIRQTLANDLSGKGRIFGQLRNDIKAGMVMGISNSGRFGQYEDYTRKDLFAWVTVGGHKICRDCDSRGGMDAQPYTFWETEGLPGSGWSVCKGYCYCVLDPSGKGSSKVQGAPVKEKRAQGRGVATTLTRNEALKIIQRHTTRGSDDYFLKKSLRKVGADENSLIRLTGLTDDAVIQIARGIEDTLGRYNININFIGQYMTGFNARGATAFASRVNSLTTDRFYMGFQKTRCNKVANPRTRAKQIAKNKESYNARRKQSIEILESNIKYYERQIADPEHTAGRRGLFRRKLEEAKEQLVRYKDPRIDKWSISSVHGESTYATTVHESWHQIDYQAPRKFGGFKQYDLRRNFQKNLDDFGVKRQEWYHVSEYGGSEIAELWAEAGTALDLGYYVPEGIKKAFIKTLEDVGLTYP
mgnify:CR=1 FL=1